MQTYFGLLWTHILPCATRLHRNVKPCHTSYINNILPITKICGLYSKQLQLHQQTHVQKHNLCFKKWKITYENAQYLFFLFLWKSLVPILPNTWKNQPKFLLMKIDQDITFLKILIKLVINQGSFHKIMW